MSKSKEDFLAVEKEFLTFVRNNKDFDTKTALELLLSNRLISYFLEVKSILVYWSDIVGCSLQGGHEACSEYAG